LNKGTKIALGVSGLLLVGCLVGFFVTLNDAMGQIDKAREGSVAEANELLILAAGQWNYDDVMMRTSSAFMPEAEAKAKFNEWNATYGALVSGEMALKDFKVADEQMKDVSLVASFESVVEFEKGKARVSMTLTRQPKNAWELASLELSPAP
jgi:hypothetical protein